MNYEIIDITKQPPNKKFLELALQQFSSNKKKVLNTRGKSFKLIDVNIEDISNKELIQLLSEDGKLLCVPIANPRQENITSINQIAPNQLEDVAEFFRTSKGLDGRTVQIDGWRDFEVIEELLRKCTPSKKKISKVLKKSSAVK